MQATIVTFLSIGIFSISRDSNDSGGSSEIFAIKTIRCFVAEITSGWIFFRTVNRTVHPECFCSYHAVTFSVSVIVAPLSFASASIARWRLVGERAIRTLLVSDMV